MARANRHYIPGYVWHITHQCHKREFLLTGECPAGGVKGHYRKTIPCREVLSQQGDYAIAGSDKILARLFRDSPRINNERTSKSSETEGSPASIFATLD